MNTSPKDNSASALLVPQPDMKDLQVQIESLTLEAECLCKALEQKEGILVHQQGLLDKMAAERNALNQQLAILKDSTSWKATAPLRWVLARFPNVARLIRRSLKAVWWSLTLQLLMRLKEKRLSRQPGNSEPLPSSSVLTSATALDDTPRAWYGAVRLTGAQLSPVGRRAADYGPGVYASLTASISRRYNHMVYDDGSAETYARLDAASLTRDHLAKVEIPKNVPLSELPPRYSIVTPFYRHTEFFQLCAKSVEALVLAARSPSQPERVEWVILNDDPTVSTDTLKNLIPSSIQAVTHLISDGKNKGIVARLNQGISTAQHPWILFLDCDDEIEPETVEVLDHYICLFPQCRYISSTMIDIDEDGNELRPRLHEYPTTELFAHGMVASHLKAIRRDLIEELGSLDPALSGVQDYDLALKAAQREPLLQIPEHLYRYRWHQKSQTVAHHVQQASLARLSRGRFLNIVGDELLR